MDRPPYRNAREHLADLLGRLRLLVQDHVDGHEARHTESSVPAPLHSFVTAAEFQHITGTPEVRARPSEAVQQLTRAIQGREEASLREGVALPVDLLRSRLNLDPVAIDLLLAVAAPDISTDIQRAYRHAYADFTVKHGNLLFFEELLGGAGAPAGAVRHHLNPDSRIRRLGLVHVRGAGADATRPLPSTCEVVPDPRLVSFILGGDLSDPHLPDGVRVLAPRTGRKLRHDAATAVAAENAYRWAVAGDGEGRRVLLEGPAGSGRRSIVQQLAGGLVEMDLAKLPTEPAEARTWWQAANREARLRGLALHGDGMDGVLVEGTPTPAARDVLSELAREPGPVFLAAERVTGTMAGLVTEEPGRVTRISVPFPTVAEQVRLWRDFLPAGVRLEDTVSLEDLAGRYSLTGGRIQAAAANAATRAVVGAADGPVIETADLESATRDELSHSLADIAHRVATPFSRADLVVMPEVRQRLEAVLTHYRFRPMVMEEWGFGRKLAYGRGLSVLFTGPPGTGKTMAASVLARELGLEMYRVELSQIIDKYIGETEKKLAKVFDEAGRGQAILLFDEADSLFAKRTEVKTSTDRYANASVNFLLQRMESYEGITVLTSNLASSFDEAFMRRIRFKVEFKVPGPEERAQLWRSMLPEEAPSEVLEGEDFESLAEEFELAGADIKSSILRAALQAADSDLPISFDLLRQGALEISRESGKVVREAPRD